VIVREVERRERLYRSIKGRGKEEAIKKFIRKIFKKNYYQRGGTL
jgi:hypothetical protein